MPKKGKVARSEWTITASEDRPLAEIARELGRLGVKNLQVHGEIGSISGSATKTMVTKMRKVRGVRDVSQLSIQLPPSDSPVTW